ncbi:hypothetical protein [Variovorax sp. dw_954]|uniref:hypothetical protein n=1 Tax=Variovorax sp. dw_954 TaxID=2720078 RepID=UPI001BD4F72A|nr:hypothetical protein [Variovorax sp. dw_954]
MRLLAARSLAWALLIGGWLVLGTLGQLRLPLWAGGLAPVALWLGTIGLGLRFGSSRVPSAAQLRAILVLAGLATVAALAWASDNGGAVAIALASIGWGVLVVAASRAARRRPACPTGLIHCALPAANWTSWSDPAMWPVQSARWAMLPMMASLAITAQWCGGAWGSAPWLSSGLHLSAMLLPSVALHLARVRLHTNAGVALAMAAGLAMLCVLPVLQGLMAASMCHSLAWGLAWSSRPGPAPVHRGSPRLAPGVLGALAPAACVWGLGLAIDGRGPWALWWVHFGLGTLATVGAAVALCRPAFFRMERKP